MQNKYEILESDCLYHIYNRANGNEKLFLLNDNYEFFLKKYTNYISPICNTYCYCLMPNHFHFLVQIKSEKEIEQFFNNKVSSSKTLQEFKTLEGLAKQESISKLLSQQFSHLFNSYTQAFNKVNNRKGSLLMHPFKRKKITDSKYLLNLVKYIHYNPIEAKLASELADWQFSSYASLISETPTFIKREGLLIWFDDLPNFKFFHKTIEVKPYYLEE